MNRSSEQGSAIIWILVALATFAALNYAFNSSNRTSTALLTDEEAQAYANQIIAYGNDVKAAVKRLQLRGCDETEISFENSVVSGYTNPNSPANRSCHVFDVNGGGLSWLTPSDKFAGAPCTNGWWCHEYAFEGDNKIPGVGTSNTASESAELSIRLSGIDLKTCQTINEILGLNPTPVTAGFYVYKFVGSFDSGNNNYTSLTTNGEKSGCYYFDSATPEYYTYYNVLIVR